MKQSRQPVMAPGTAGAVKCFSDNECIVNIFWLPSVQSDMLHMECLQACCWHSMLALPHAIITFANVLLQIV
jgi:hypothetical protein